MTGWRMLVYKGGARPSSSAVTASIHNYPGPWHRVRRAFSRKPSARSWSNRGVVVPLLVPRRAIRFADPPPTPGPGVGARSETRSEYWR
jgi:hypothetical protein